MIKHQTSHTTRADGSILWQSDLALGPVAKNISVWLHHWAATTPKHNFLMERSGAGWRELTYGETLQQVQAVAATLLSRGLGPKTPIVVLSGPGIDHGVLMLAAQYVGIPIAPFAEQYSLIPQANARLEQCIRKVKPALIYASDGIKYQQALSLDSLASVTKVVSTNVVNNTEPFEALLQGHIDESLQQACEQVGPDSLAKIIFTSGSTGNPKGVPQTQKMITVNQAQYSACLPWLSEKPPVLVDWLPWNHVFAGNSNFYMILCNGGTLVLDDGKPIPGLFDRTLENLSMHVGTLSLNVPAAYALLVKALHKDKTLMHRFFSDLDMLFYAGASLPADVWNALETMSTQVSGKACMMTSSWGLTETAPACLLHYEGGAESGMIGVPMPELLVKLIPYQNDRFEIRVKGPNVIPAYYDEPEKDASSFDDEGYFKTNDTVTWADPKNTSAGLKFAGRLSEDFKLLTGTWVQSAIVRLQALEALEGLVHDVVVTGADQSDIGLLIFPLSSMTLINDGEVVTDALYAEKIKRQLQAMSKSTTDSSKMSSSKTVVRFMILAQPPLIEAAEITAKGSLNSHAVVANRSALVQRLYAYADSACFRVR